jgi:Fe2+ transport system protein FeoA
VKTGYFWTSLAIPINLVWMNLLSEKPINFQGKISTLTGAPEIADRLRELGFTTGEVIRIVGRAPLGEPLMVEVRGAIVALRNSEAACIQM